MKDSVKDRLVAFINAMGLNYTEFGNKIGVSNSYVTSMRTSLSPDKFAKIASAYPQLNIVWLMTGEGEMFNDGYKPEVNNVRLFARMIKEIKYQEGLNQQKIADELGVTRQQLSDMCNGRREVTEDIINKVYDRFDFLRPKNVINVKNATGSIMAAPLQTFLFNVVNVKNATGSIVTGGDNSGNVYNGIKDKSEKKPIIPDNIVTVPNLDVLDYVKENTNVEYSNVIVEDTPITLWHRVGDNALNPDMKEGDMIGLLSYKRGKEMVIPGKIYAVDTFSNGIVVRYLYPTDNGYLAKSNDNKTFPDFIIGKDDVIRIYRKMLMVRYW